MSEAVYMPEETGESSEEEGKLAGPPTGRALVDAILDGKAWDAAFVEDLWQRNQEAVRLLEQGLACPKIQAPPMRFDSEIPEVFGWLYVARLLELHAIFLLKEGKHEAALDEAMRLVRFGHRIEGCKGGLVQYLVGAMLKKTGLSRLRAMVSATTLSPEVLVACARRLGDYRANEQGVADALRVEYEAEIQILEDVKAGKYSLREIMSFDGSPPRPGSPPPPFLLHPNETRRLFVEAIRPMVESVPLPYAEMKPKLESIPDMRDISPDWRTWLKGNLEGVRLYSLIMPMPAIKDFLAQTCQEDVELAATRTLVSLKAFKVEKGRLPETLDELVPEYLDAVPLDDFDGKPLRYNAEKKIVYSVGKDLVDAGGMTKEEQKAWWKEENPGCEEDVEPGIWQMPDPSFAIEF